MPRIWCFTRVSWINDTYLVRKEFTNHKKVFNIEYASLSINEKQKIKKLLLNIPVDLKSFTNVSSFRASHNALKNVRTNMAKVISQDSKRYAVTSECNTVVSSQQGKNFSASIEDENAMESLDGLMFILQDAPPEKEVKNNDVMPAFTASQYFVKSYSWPNGLPHLVSCCENGLIKCDSNCPRYNSEEFCGHTIAVALKNKTVQSFASALSKCNEKTTTSVASQKIKSNVVGRKVPVRIRKPPLEVLKNFQPQQSGIQLSKYLTSVTQLWFMIHLKPII